MQAWVEYGFGDLGERASRTHTFRDSHCPAWWQAAPMAAMFAELLPWLIMRYLGEISHTEDRASRERTGLGLAVLPRKAESNLCSALCFLGAGS